jgi:hypothetical protein
MSADFELRFEIEPIAPDTLVYAKSQLHSVIVEAIDQSELGQHALDGPQTTFEQHLPLTKEGVETAVLVLQFALEHGPSAWKMFKSFLAYLQLHASQASTKSVEIDLKIGDLEIKAKGVTFDDAVSVVTEEYEVEFRPRKRK